MTDPFQTLNTGLQHRIDTLTQRGFALFQTSVNGDVLWEAFLKNLPANQRQYHTCRCCQSFFRKYAGLVFINDSFELESIWPNTAPSMYVASIDAIKAKIKKSTVRAIFNSAEPVLGRYYDGGFEHFAFDNPNRVRPGALSAFELEALSLEHHKTLTRALLDFDLDIVEKAHSLLTADSFYRSDKFLGPVEFLRSIHAAQRGVRGAAKRDNVVWKALVGAPAGFATPRSSVVGTLIEDLKAGLSVRDAAAKFAAKTKPTAYQRPVAPAKAGNIAQADKLVDRLGLARSFERRYASVAELSDLSVWSPSPAGVARQAPTSGLFGGSLPARRAPAPVQGSSKTMSWAKFERTMLSSADKIEMRVTRDARNYGAYVTAVHAEAPLLFQWGNHVSWYVYTPSSLPSRFSLTPGMVELTSVLTRPCPGDPNWGEARLLALKGARDNHHSGLALFPEIIRSDLKGFRATIEEFSKRGRVQRQAGENAAGLLISDREFLAFDLHVTIGSTVVMVTIDRFE